MYLGVHVASDLFVRQAAFRAKHWSKHGYDNATCGEASKRTETAPPNTTWRSGDEPRSAEDADTRWPAMTILASDTSLALTRDPWSAQTK